VPLGRVTANQALGFEGRATALSEVARGGRWLLLWGVAGEVRTVQFAPGFIVSTKVEFEREPSCVATAIHSAPT
jgi:hypothetical protein